LTYVYPDFYDDFTCIADRCRHSCCRGWEIDIDPAALARFRAVKGPMGERLRRSISPEPTPHFVLDAEENCPFLRQDGLCDMILTLGEDALCDICAEHPRFYAEYPHRLEMGLGLCCEEAVRLLLAGTGPLLLEEEREGDAPAPQPPVLALRQEILNCLADPALPFSRRAARVMTMAGGAYVPVNLPAAAEFYLTLEQMDPDWAPLLCCLRDSRKPLPAPEGETYGRIVSYFVFRHFAAGEADGTLLPRLRFALLTGELLCALDTCTDAGLPALLRLYSAEIEYSDENIDAILAWLSDC